MVRHTLRDLVDMAFCIRQARSQATDTSLHTYKPSRVWCHSRHLVEMSRVGATYDVSC